MIEIVVIAAGALALLAGFSVLWRVPRLSEVNHSHAMDVSLIVPARNEEQSLPRLLGSIQQSSDIQVIVVDDHSTDATSAVAHEFRADVVRASELPPGWTGKTWACVQGADAADRDVLLFVDADTWFEPQGLQRLVHSRESRNMAVSLIPYHITIEPYEELSLFFNLLMASGAGGFGLFGRPRLFGQSLLIHSQLYRAAGTHRSVRREILENFALAEVIESAGGRCICIGGRGVLNMRMFSGGVQQLSEGWMKAFVSGAAKTPKTVLLVAIVWMTLLCFELLCLLMSSGSARLLAAVVYLVLAVQIAWMGRQIGTFRWYTALLFPIPLLLFFGLFAWASTRRALGRQATWRGRRV